MVNEIYPVATDSDGSNPPEYVDQRNGIVLLHLLDLLISHYPSQSAFYAALRSRRTVVASIRPHIRMYAAAVATAMRRANYAALHQLALPTNPLHIQAIEHYGPKQVPTPEHIYGLGGVRERTLDLVLRRLRALVRQDAWRVVRTAYREVTIGTGEDSPLSKDARNEKEGNQCLPMPTQRFSAHLQQ
ncbi:hypothetical protein BS47DRAFT_422126 [Hydnum rufescens UP504]|uniref:Uncharacterized protein n=1 Tax=Hydnum rufescens UP504 TaxID=1448309 RepID=A0A9P6B577_9AGAM|nr:hypothetical protein BS47DRAFT_422126 [Hydnum rufescens UP504]